MANSFDRQLDLLVKLQGVQKQMKTIRAGLADVDARCDAIRSTTDAMMDAVAKEEARIASIKKENRDKERQVQDLSAKIKKSEEKLLSVKTNKEYHSSLKEIDDLKKKISDLEDLMLSEFEEIESGDDKIRDLNRSLEEEKAEGEQQIAEILDEAEKRRTSLEALEAEYRQLCGQIPESLHQRYEHIRVLQSNDVAVSEVINAVCQGCNVNIPPQLYNQLQKRDQLYNCPNCGRIIFWVKRIV